MDSAFRIKEINAAREKIGAGPYLGNDAQIRGSFELGLCEELVKGDGSYEAALLKSRDKRKSNEPHERRKEINCGKLAAEVEGLKNTWVARLATRQMVPEVLAPNCRLRRFVYHQSLAGLS